MFIWEKGDDKMKKIYTCRYDRTFKEIFMNENNKDILSKLLESILDVEIYEIKYLNLEKNSSNIHIKSKRFDLHLKTNIGYIQVEVNTSSEDYVRVRNTAYLCDTYSHYTLSGENYDKEYKIIQINFSYGVKNNNELSIYKLKDEYDKQFVDNLMIYEFYMDKLLYLWHNKDKKNIDKYKYVMMLDLLPEELKDLSKDKVVDKYMEELERVN